MATRKPHLFIGGAWVESQGSAEPLHVVDPATEEIIAEVVRADRKDTVRAIEAARTAFDEGPWPRLRPRERAATLLRMAEIIERRKAEFVDLLIREAGSPRAMAEPVQFGICLEHFVDLAERVVSKFEPIRGIPPVVGQGVGQGVVMDEPAGVASLITAFNFPHHLNLMKLGPALGAGCTTVLKPSELTPLVSLLLGEVAEEAGLPPGVLNIVPGDAEAGAEMTTHPAVDLVSFTGSSAVGKSISRQAADTVKRVVLELGGKSAGIVFADADLDAAAQNVVMNMTLHSGQACVLNTRTLVESSVHDELVERVIGILAAIKVGDPSDESTMMGPLISARQRDRVEGYIRSGIEQGGHIAVGGGRPEGLDKGFYIEPTLFTGCSNDMTIAQEEIFGPVGTVIPFRDQDEAVRLANDTRYGLGAGVWTRDPLKAYEVAQRMRAGAVMVNGGPAGNNTFGPYGGYKESGLGREFGEFGFSEYLESKSIAWPAIV
ncbi:aldehyde dehydrogenase family protein [Actinomadura sp. LOL_016]|uniref:aldehyde dehydrogenase family protein n=1 Tax=unclassified Actinomadura TaxID=2626254 RepID=UPI003A7F8288